MAAKKSTPTIRLRRLARQLRLLREDAGLSREEVEEQTGINQATIYRIETAKVRPQNRTLMTMLTTYGCPAEEQAAMRALSKEATKPGWIRPWHAGLPEEYTTYISFEDEAQGVRNYSSLFVPGLLQTEDYARSVISGVLPSATAEQVEDRVKTRVERQAILSKETPLNLWVVIDEAALRRAVGSTEIMRKQRQHLVEAAEAPNVTIQVLRFGDGAHPGMPGEFIVLEFEDPMDGDLIHVDSQAGEVFLESDADIKRFRGTFDSLVAMAASPKDSVAFIAEIDASD
ncbi:helix-turn-helix transcriptional regulator [Actinosynnema pretiosum subsp. pretiosum]|uniref:Transcriptional regulator, XRE family n=2 Tax=Actinosynnema TaxID=40566 RepID=C6WHH9_ACTMD|nr:helix-turn-helix transcriptional regulator [Actinosynnema mirum]ACU39928.1 transcriptional regulator, XRE family [Actinosynnema mirum DSM 43827]QUF02751.1 helix-turn-helix transcriptional regulator [Actinosynnema pretiosum subsp. pretiosum]